MKKIVSTFLLAFITFFIINTTSYAENQDGIKTYKYSDGKTIYSYIDKDKKTKITINKNDLYAYAYIYIDSNKEKRVFIGDIDLKYNEENETFLVNIKRSQINNSLKKYAEDATNIINLLGVSLDYYDIKDGDIYFNGREDCDLKKNSVSTEYGFEEIFNITTSLFLDSEYKKEGKLLYLNDLDEKYLEDNYCINNIETKNAIFNFSNYKFKINIIEDEKMYFSNNLKNILKSSKDGISVKVEDINNDNFYAQYDDNNKLNYSFSLYDENKKFKKIDFDTEMKFNESEYEENIRKNFDIDNNDNIIYLSFKYNGDLNGHAKLSIYVGDKFHESEKLNLYYYDIENNKIEIQDIKDIIVDKEGYINLDINHLSEYVLTNDKVHIVMNEEIKQLPVQEVPKKNIIILSVLSGIIVCIMIIIALNRGKDMKKENEITKE